MVVNDFGGVDDAENGVNVVSERGRMHASALSRDA